MNVFDQNGDTHHRLCIIKTKFFGYFRSLLNYPESRRLSHFSTRKSDRHTWDMHCASWQHGGHVQVDVTEIILGNFPLLKRENVSSTPDRGQRKEKSSGNN